MFLKTNEYDFEPPSVILWSQKRKTSVELSGKIMDKALLLILNLVPLMGM